MVSVRSRAAVAIVALLCAASCSRDAPASAAPAARPDASPSARTPWEETGPRLDVVELTAERIQLDLAAGRYTSTQLVQAYLDRIALHEPLYNAFVSMNPAALAVAAALDEEYRRSGPRGPLHGVPVVIKDNLDYGGLVTTAGFAGFSAAAGGIDMVPGRDAAVVARLRAAGAIVLGKTNLPDFAGDGTRTTSTVAGATRNPWALDRAPGGSSGGTATAVNASFAVLGLGTETGGSIQNPAAAQGLVGVKPTFGLVPLDGVVPIDATYRDVVGPLARTVHDAALALDALVGASGAYTAALDTVALRGKRFGLVGTGWREQYLPLAPETEVLYRKAIASLRARGAEVVEDPFRGTEWRERYGRRRAPVASRARDLAAYLRGLGPAAAFRSIGEWERLSGRSFRGGSDDGEPAAAAEGDYQRWQRDMQALFRSVLQEHDLDGLFFPQAGAPIRPLVEDSERPDFSPNNHPELPSNIVDDVGLPVITLPVGWYADGMPFVVAFIGDLRSEAALLGWAYDLERATRARAAPALVTDTLR
jgi:Asp-tRNA(Asn)/Glu-tRNA(Gln) amidotransferase A subunit family amidase